MYLFIATIFIAELVIAGALISSMVKLDKKARDLNKRLIAFKPVLEECLGCIKDIVFNLQNTMESFFTFVKKKRQQFVSKIIIAVVMYSSLVFFKGKYKKAAAIFQTLVLVKDYWDELTT